jgi:hypothetical protein
MAKVVSQDDGLGERFVDVQSACQGARNLGGLQGVRQPRAEVIVEGGRENLRLMFETPEGGAFDDAMPIELEGAAEGVVGLCMDAPAR